MREIRYLDNKMPRRRAIIGLVAGYIIFCFGLLGLRTNFVARVHLAPTSVELAVLSGFLVVFGGGFIDG